MNWKGIQTVLGQSFGRALSYVAKQKLTEGEKHAK